MLGWGGGVCGLCLGEVDAGQGSPEVFSEGGGDGFLAVVGELAEGVVVLGFGISDGFQIEQGRVWGDRRGQ